MSPRSRSYQPAVSDYLFDLRRGWRVVAGSVLALAIFAVAISATQDEVYRASSDLLLQQAPSRATLISGTSREISTELELARSRRVEKLAVDSLGFRPAVSFHRISDTALIRVTAEASTAAKAARAADAYARAFIEARSSQVLGPLASVRDELQSKLDEVTLADSGTAPASDVDPAAVDDLVALAESVRAAAADGDPGDLRSAIASLQRTLGPGQSDASIRIIRGASLQLLIDEIDAAESLSRNAAPDLVSEAEIPDSPSRPAPARNLVLAIALGVIAGVCIVLLRSYLDRRIHRAAELEAVTGLPVLAVVATRGRGDAGAIDMQELRTALQLRGVGETLRTLQVTSPRPFQGSDHIVEELADALARLGFGVVLVHADAHGHDGQQPGVSLADFNPADLPARVIEGTVYRITSGPPSADPAAFFGSRRFREAIDVLAARSDLVVVSGPPALGSPDALLIGRHVSATVITAAVGTTTVDDAEETVARLKEATGSVIGAVLAAPGPRVRHQTRSAPHAGAGVEVPSGSPGAERPLETQPTTPL